MVEKIRSVTSRLGIDGAIIYTVFARIIQAGGGVVAIIFIAKYLSVVEQGYYFTFGSILAIQIFFELGLSNIITQFVAHEIAHLKWVDKIELAGSKESLSRLSSLLRFCVKWFSVIAILLILILIFTGYFFFSKYGKGDANVNWQFPWLILSITTGLSLMASPILAFFDGLGMVKQVAKIRLIQQISQLFVLFVFFVAGFKLFSSPLASIVTFAIVPIWIFFSYQKNLLIFIWNQLGDSWVDYKLEIFPYQWRIALSWISGYFIFQLFNPVLFATAGSKVAGQMGMTLAALGGILSISLSWINTKVPLFSGLIAQKDYNRLDEVFYRTLKQACFICSICLVVFISLIYSLKRLGIGIGDRFLPMFPLVLLSLCTFSNQLVSALATYLRCHKQEPFLVQSVVLGVLTGLSTLVLGNFFGLNGIVIGYFILATLVSLVWSTFIFYNKKSLWHQ